MEKYQVVNMAEIDLRGITLEGVNKGDEVDFSGVTTTDELKRKIMENYISLCRKCSFSKDCIFYEKSKGDPCILISNVLKNYIVTNIISNKESDNINNRYYMKNFIESCINLIFMFLNTEWLNGCNS